MSAGDYAGFLDALGHRVLRCGDAWWFDARPGVFLAFPYHRPLRVDRPDLESVLGVRWLFARHTCPQELGRHSHAHVRRAADYGMGALSVKARNQVRRGLEHCRVRRVSFSELQAMGAVDLIGDTLRRQGRGWGRAMRAHWDAFLRTAGSCRGMEAWAAFASDRLAAFLIATAVEDCLYILHQFSCTDLLRARPNNALVFTVTSSVSRRSGLKEVCYGLEPLQGGLTGLEHFKEGMGFSKRPLGQRIEVNPLVRALLGHPLRRAVIRVADRMSHREAFGKLAGILRGYGEQPRLMGA